MNGGIDQQIQQKVDAYRGNPQALQQRYAQNQQLIDLLALQKLKSEKEAAARDIQMKMQQSPQTIKDQREAELMQMTKDDLAKQTGQLLEQRQAKSQNNLQRVAQAGLPAAMSGQVQMAGGGIVAFSNGGMTEQVPTDMEIGMTEEERKRLEEERMRRRLTPMLRRPDSGAVSRARDETNERIRRAIMGTGEDVFGGADVSPSAITTEDRATDQFAAQRRAGAIPTMRGPDAESARAAAEALARQQESQAQTQQTQPGGGITSVVPQGGFGKINAPQVPGLTGGLKDLQDKAVSASSSMLGIDPKTEMRERRQETADFLGRGAKAKSYEDMVKRLEALDKEQMDPEKLRREELSAFLRGAGGRSSFGSVMAGASGAAADTRRQQEIARRARLMDQLGIEQKAIETDLDIGKQGVSAGMTAYEQASLDKRQALQTARNLGSDEMTRLQKQAEMEMDADKANLNAAVERAKILANEALRTEVQRSTDINTLSGRLNDVNKAIGDIFQAYLDTPEIRGLELKASAADAEQKDIDAYKKARDMAHLKAEHLANQAGLQRARDMLQKRVNSLVGAGGESIQAGDVASVRQVQ
jgi:hypothetical protein